MTATSELIFFVDVPFRRPLSLKLVSRSHLQQLLPRTQTHCNAGPGCGGEVVAASTHLQQLLPPRSCICLRRAVPSGFPRGSIGDFIIVGASDGTLYGFPFTYVPPSTSSAADRDDNSSSKRSSKSAAARSSSSVRLGKNDPAACGGGGSGGGGGGGEVGKFVFEDDNAGRFDVELDGDGGALIREQSWLIRTVSDQCHSRLCTNPCHVYSQDRNSCYHTESGPHCP